VGVKYLDRWRKVGNIILDKSIKERDMLKKKKKLSNSTQLFRVFVLPILE
jgi:hypothetical protein